MRMVAPVVKLDASHGRVVDLPGPGWPIDAFQLRRGCLAPTPDAPDHGTARLSRRSRARRSRACRAPPTPPCTTFVTARVARAPPGYRVPMHRFAVTVRALLVGAPLFVGSTACGTSQDALAPTTSAPPAGTATSGATPTTRTSTSTSTSTTASTTTTTTSTTTTAPPTTSTTTTSPPAPPAVLETGDTGSAVSSLQVRLDELGYWVGPHDGVYGTLTEQAVYAFQKANALSIDGKVGPEARAALDAPTPFAPQSTKGTVWEIDKARQLLVLVQDGTPRWIWNTSTGTEQPYTHNGRDLVADTPPGHYTVEWQVDGWRNGTLGPIYRPKYFHHDGLAIHGYGRVPPYPASHGCVRVTLPAMDYIWSTDLAPEGAAIWVYGTIPG